MKEAAGQEGSTSAVLASPSQYSLSCSYLPPTCAIITAGARWLLCCVTMALWARCAECCAKIFDVAIVRWKCVPRHRRRRSPFRLERSSCEPQSSRHRPMHCFREQLCSSVTRTSLHAL